MGAGLYAGMGAGLYAALGLGLGTYGAGLARGAPRNT